MDCGSAGKFKEVQLPKLSHERVWLTLGILGKLQDKYEEATKLGTAGVKTFFNTEMGIPYEEDTETLQSEELYERREDYGAELPDGVLLLTCGVDTQDDRLECEIVGWGKDYESWGIQYFRLYGDPA